MKNLYKLVYISLVLLLFGGCDNSSSGKVNLRFWNGFTGPDGRTMKKLVRKFNSENPDVQYGKFTGILFCLCQNRLLQLLAFLLFLARGIDSLVRLSFLTLWINTRCRLASLFFKPVSMEYGITLAACLVCTVPVVIIFIIFQKHIIKGIALTGLKG